jgi:hypothetical protein
MKGSTAGRGCVAENEVGVLGVAIDYFSGEWRGFELPRRARRWTSAEPRRWLGPVVPYLRSQLPGGEGV